MEAPAAKRATIVKEWLTRTLHTYPEQTVRFLAGGKDPFRNPVGHTLEEAFPVLVDELLGGMDRSRIAPLLDQIVRIRAVQDFSASQAVAFVFLLKPVVHEALEREGQRDQDGVDLAALDERIDQMALLAFDLFMKCREQIYEMRVNEARRRTFLLARIQERAEAR